MVISDVYFTLYAVLVYFQLNYGLLLYLKLTRVDVGNVSKKGKNISVFARWFLTKLCLYIADCWSKRFNPKNSDH